MTRLLGSLTNRLFLASATLAVASILAAVWWMERSITAQTERDIDRGLAEAGALVDEYRRLSLSQLAQAAELIADLPKFKAAVELNDPPTVAPLAADYRRELNADVFIVTGRDGRVLAQEGLRELTGGAPPSTFAWDPAGPARTVRFLPGSDGIVQLVTVPVWIDPAAPDVLGVLSVGVALDSRFASQIEQFTDSDIAFTWNGRVKVATIDATWRSALERLLDAPGGRRVWLGGEEYAAIVRALSEAIPAGSSSAPVAPSVADPRQGGAVIVLRSRTEQLRPLRTLHTALGFIALTAVLAATISSYLVARTVTRPIRAITAAMRDMAATGDLTRGTVPSPRWGDEDARLLAHTFNTMTAAIERFQRDATQRERLSSLGRLSTVIAHEIRNPLMIIRSALRTLRRSPHVDEPVRAAVEDIDGEVGRLDRLVKEVLDFARPIRFDLAPARLSAICEDAARAAGADDRGVAYRLRFDPAADAVVTDAERLREALVNLLTNARESMSGPAGAPPPAGTAAEIEVTTRAIDGEKVQISIRDRGPGIDPAALPRIFEPFFTTKTTGTGIGLAITSNIINGLGGSVQARSAQGEGTEMVIELPRAARAREARS